MLVKIHSIIITGVETYANDVTTYNYIWCLAMFALGIIMPVQDTSLIKLKLCSEAELFKISKMKHGHISDTQLTITYLTKISFLV